jgi:hypothetical protein
MRETESHKPGVEKKPKERRRSFNLVRSLGLKFVLHTYGSPLFSDAMLR